MDLNREKLKVADDNVKKMMHYLENNIVAIPKGDINIKQIYNFYKNEKNKRHFDHEFVCIADKQITLIAETSSSITNPRPAPVIWFWNNSLCPIYTLTCNWVRGKQKIVCFRAFFAVGSQALDLFLYKPIQIILFRNGKCVSAFELFLPTIDSNLWELLDPSSPEESIQDEKAAKFWVESNLNRDKVVTGKQAIEFAWADKLEREVSIAIRSYRKPKPKYDFSKEQAIVNTSSFASFFTDDQKVASNIYHTFEQSFWTGYNRDISATMTVLNSELADAPLHWNFIKYLICCAWFSPKGTSNGKKIVSVDLDGTYHSLSIDQRHYWERIPLEIPLYYYQLFGDKSCPVDIKEFVSKLPLYYGNLHEGKTFVNNLLLEAYSLKQWTIPFGAYVQLDAGNLNAAKVYEIGNDVACVLVDQHGNYFLVWIHPASKKISFVVDANYSYALGLRVKSELASKENGKNTTDSESLKEELNERLELGIKILVASIIRDFWVVEERQRVFGIGYKTRKNNRLRSDEGKKAIVYLPRIKYVSDIKDHADALNLVARSPHFVTGHLRKALHASETQILLARRHGITVPEGFTFIKPHRRGDKVQEQIYRSRSALQCINALKLTETDQNNDTWFQYEINVKNWLASNGYEADHLSASRNGDGGVDIQACKGNEFILVQCKYRTTDKIGPEVIREMMGTLQTFPKGSRGVIITTTDLTSGAKELAAEHGIQFIVGIDFATSINYEI